MMICHELLKIPFDQSEQESYFVLRSDTLTALTTPPLQVEQIFHRVTEHVEGVDDNRQEKPYSYHTLGSR